MDQNGRPIDMEHKVNFTVLINKQKCDEQKNMLNDVGFLHFQENIRSNY